MAYRSSLLPCAVVSSAERVVVLQARSSRRERGSSGNCTLLIASSNFKSDSTADFLMARSCPRVLESPIVLQEA